MSEYDNELRGALFKNKNMREGKKDPEYKGSATIGGVEYWVSSWINTSKAGEKYMSMAFKAKEQQAAPAPKAEELKAPADTDPFHDDDIPF
jgi:hypothetical protein